MNKLSIATLAGLMAVSTCALAADEVSPAPQAKPQDCSKLSGKKKDECVQATPAGPVDMKTGKQEKGKSEIAKDRDRKKKDPTAQPGETTGQAPQPVGTDAMSKKTQ